MYSCSFDSGSLLSIHTTSLAAVAVIAIAGAVTAGIMLYHYNNEKQDDKLLLVQCILVLLIQALYYQSTQLPLPLLSLLLKQLSVHHYSHDYHPYFIKVNRAANCATVYGIDENGEYTIPVKAFATSCGKAGDETIVGENYVTSDKYEWGYMVDGTYGRYAFRISGGYLFHSVPYYSMNKGDLEDGQYNKLGDYASLGCVRMCVRDVKWIYDNCPSGTGVTIYDDAVNPGPLGKPDSIKIPEDSAYAGWDPTDPDENNPWNAYSAKIEGAKDIQTKIGQSVDVMTGVTATDTCGNDITAKIVTVGRYTFDQTGTYDIKYEVTDAIGSHDEVTVKLMVTE